MGKREVIAAALLQDPKRALERVTAERARRDAEAGSKSFYTFVKQAWRLVPQVEPLVLNWHLEALCMHAERTFFSAVNDAENFHPARPGDITELCVNMPPGLSKSVLYAVLLPAWVWTFWPRCQILVGSYSHGFVLRDARRCREVIASEWYLKTYCKSRGWTLRDDFGSADNFSNTAGGVRFATSVGGAGAGLRAHLIIIDDPVNITAGQGEHEAAISWCGQVLSQRFVVGHPQRMIMVMQRLETYDPSNWFVREQGAVNLRLASEYVPSKRCETRTTDGTLLWSDPRKQQGELLFPALYPKERVEAAKKKLGPFGYAAQHGQDPTPPGGGRFKIDNWNFWTTDKSKMSELGYGATSRPEGCTDREAKHVELEDLEQIITVDANVKETSSGSYCCIHVWGQIGARKLLLDVDKGRWEFAVAVERLKAMTIKWPNARRKVVEGKANGDAIVSHLKTVHGIGGLETVPTGTESKRQRSKVMEPYHSAGDMEVPEGAPWMPETIGEYAKFPKGENDDEIDCGAMACATFEQPLSIIDRYAEEYGEDVDAETEDVETNYYGI